MQIIGRITADATVNTTKDKRKVVHFSIAMNDRYKTKDSEQPTVVTTYVNCSYWISTAIAAYLSKGRLVELEGRISVSAWKDTQSEARASLNFHVNNIKLHGGKTPLQPATAETTTGATLQTQNDDLPF